MANDWLELRQHADTGIETIKAHFEGHAFDPHWHDSYLVGITLSGTQQFHCRRERHRSQRVTHFSSSLARSTTVMRL